MAENYSYPDTHEMFELYDVLEVLLSKKNTNIGLFEGLMYPQILHWIF